MRTDWSTDPLANRLPSQFQSRVNTCRGRGGVNKTVVHGEDERGCGMEDAACSAHADGTVPCPGGQRPSGSSRHTFLLCARVTLYFQSFQLEPASSRAMVAAAAAAASRCYCRHRRCCCLLLQMLLLVEPPSCMWGDAVISASQATSNRCMQ